MKKTREALCGFMRDNFDTKDSAEGSLMIFSYSLACLVLLIVCGIWFGVMAVLGLVALAGAPGAALYFVVQASSWCLVKLT